MSSNGIDSAIRAYDHATGEHRLSNDIPGTRLNGNNNNAPWGIWADETTLWVADSNDNIVYAYWKDNPDK